MTDKTKELPDGYKNTELGVIPEDWDVKTLGELIFDYRGGAPLKPSDFINEGIKVLPKLGVGEGGILFVPNAKQKYCSNEYCKMYPRSIVDKNYNIVVLRDLVPSGPSIGYVVEIIDNDIYLLAQGVYGFRVESDKLEARYIIYLSNSNWYRKYMQTLLVGSTQVHIRNSDYRQIQIPVPPLPEQKAIAEVLGDTDELIRSLDALIEKKKNVKQGMMQELLTGKRRLPGFGGKNTGYKDTELGVIPEDWDVKFLMEIGEIYMGGTPSTSIKDYWDGEIAWCTPTDITALKQSIYIHQTKRNITKAGLKNSSANMIAPYSIIITTRATIGECAINKIPITTNQGFKSITPNENTDSEYLFFYITTLKKIFESLGSGSTFNEVSKKDISNTLIPIPPLSEQKAIAEVLSDMDAEIEALEQKREKMKLVKLGMMQELLTGRIRLV